MKPKVFPLSLLCFAAIMLSCSEPKPKSQASNPDPFPVKYENELFSIKMPEGWVCDDSSWKGLDSFKNEVDIYDPDGSAVCFHIVKTFMPMEWENIGEATEMAVTMRAIDDEKVDLIDEIDSVDVGGYLTNILYFANYVDNDTIIQKQFVTYLPDSHIVIYFNEIFNQQQFDDAEDLGDEIMRTVKLKKVINPLENEDKLKAVLESAMENSEIDEDAIKRVESIVNSAK